MSKSFKFISDLAKKSQSGIIYINGKRIEPIQSFLNKKVLSGETSFFLPRSIYSKNSFKLQSNHEKMIQYIKEQGWNIDLHHYKIQGCDNWYLQPTERKYYPVYQTTIFVKLKEY